MVARRLPAGWYYGVSLPAFALALVAAVAIGSTPLAWSVVLQCAAKLLLPQGWVDTSQVTKADEVIFWMIRFPRVIVAALVGAGLATAGAIMQAIFRNPLAEPGLTGAGAGAVLGAVVAFVMGWSTQAPSSLPACAMAGSLLALAVVYFMATRGGVTPMASLLLAGIATTSLLSAISSLLLSLNIVNWQIAQEIVFWMMGGLDARSWTHVWLCGPFVLFGGLVALLYSPELDLLQQGEEVAASLGVNVEKTKRIFILTAAVLTGASVAVAGMVGFVGLVAPHAVRLLLGPSNRTLLPASALCGALFLVLCDLMARTAHPPVELRLGVITSLAGGPLFIALLLRRHQEASRA
ncbi:MAG: iron ABC transporter permease [Bryobacteraceae bacterium]|nr:iron ABC transporter permease [Bryobacteraceae bacterium]MDW8377652.1 iron ABC transporter permease [Bryobacterales bacterium]